MYGACDYSIFTSVSLLAWFVGLVGRCCWGVYIVSCGVGCCDDSIGACVGGR